MKKLWNWIKGLFKKEEKTHLGIIEFDDIDGIEHKIIITDITYDTERGIKVDFTSPSDLDALGLIEYVEDIIHKYIEDVIKKGDLDE